MKGHLRYAKEEDMELLFQWANDPMTRRNAFSTEKISYEEHKEWYRKILQREDCRQYIYMYDNEAIGQVRVEVYEDVAELDYSICAEKRCMGFGKKMIQQIEEQIRIDFPEIKSLIAKVKSDNAASQKVFLDTGYEKKYSVFELELNTKI